METIDILFLAIGAVHALGGLASIITGKVYLMGRSAEKYTDESLQKYARPYGLLNLISGLGLVLMPLLNGGLFKIGSYEVSTGVAVMVAALVICLIIGLTTRNILVKK